MRPIAGVLGLKEGFTIIKQGIAFHSPMRREIPDFFLGTSQELPFHGWRDSGFSPSTGCTTSSTASPR